MAFTANGQATGLGRMGNEGVVGSLHLLDQAVSPASGVGDRTQSEALDITQEFLAKCWVSAGKQCLPWLQSFRHMILLLMAGVRYAFWIGESWKTTACGCYAIGQQLQRSLYRHYKT